MNKIALIVIVLVILLIAFAVGLNFFNITWDL